MANDALATFLDSGGKTDVVSDYKSDQPAMPEAANDPMGQFLSSGGKDTATLVKGYGDQIAQPDQRGYIEKIKDAAVKFNESGSGPMDTVKALGENALSMATGAPISLLKHGVEEGAYLSGQSPEQAANTAQRVIPVDGYQPSSDTGKALGGLLSAVNEPIVDVAKKGAAMVGLSPAAQNIAGDFAPVVAGKAVAAAPDALRALKNAPSDIANGWRGAVARGRALEQQPAQSITPQMIRGQEPVPAELQPQDAVADAPKEAPPITIENASPQLQKAVAQHIEQNGTPPNPTVLERQLVGDSLPVKVTFTPGQASGDIHLLSDEFNKRGTPNGQAYADRFNAQNGELIGNIEAFRDRVAPDLKTATGPALGDHIIDAYTDMTAKAEAQVNANYKALADANGGSIPINGKAFAQSTQNALGKGLVNYDEFLPSKIKNMVTRIGESEQPMTFDDFVMARKVLSAAARAAARSEDGGNAVHAINIVRDNLESIPMSGAAESLLPLADAAKNSHAQLKQSIAADPIWKAIDDGKATPDSVLQKHIINGTRDSMATASQNLADYPLAKQALAAGTIDALRKGASISEDYNGNFSQSGYSKTFQALKPKLPAVLDPITLQQSENLMQAARWAQQQPRGSYFNNSNTATALMKSAKEGGETVVNAKTYGAYGALKNMVTGTKQAKAAAEATKPGAGLSLKDMGK